MELSPISAIANEIEKKEKQLRKKFVFMHLIKLNNWFFVSSRWPVMGPIEA